MISDTKVVFRGLDHSPAVEEVVNKRLDKLERFNHNIQSLRVILEAPHNNHHKGNVFHVTVEAMLPQHDLVVNNDQHDKHSHEDIYVAIRDAFDAMERRLKSVTGKQRSFSRVKAAEELSDELPAEAEPLQVAGS